MDNSEGGVDDVEVDGTIITKPFSPCTQEGGRMRWPSTSIENAPKNMLMSMETSCGICSEKKPHACKQPIDISFKYEICCMTAPASCAQTQCPVTSNVNATVLKGT